MMFLRVCKQLAYSSSVEFYPLNSCYAGVLQYEAKLLLKYCIDKKYFSTATVSRAIEGMELGYMEANNKPTVIAAQILCSADNRLSQNG